MLQNFTFRMIENVRPFADSQTWEVMVGPRRMALCTHKNDAEHIVECLKENAQREREEKR